MLKITFVNVLLPLKFDSLALRAIRVGCKIMKSLGTSKENGGNICTLQEKTSILAASEYVSDAAVSNWTGGFGHPRRRFTRGVRQNVSD